MDFSIDKMLKENDVLPMQIWYSLKLYKDNIKKFQNYLNFISNSSYEYKCQYIVNSTFLNTSNYTLPTNFLNDGNNIECMQEFLTNISNVYEDDRSLNGPILKFAHENNNSFIRELFLNTSVNTGRRKVISDIIDKINNLNSSKKIGYKNYCNELPTNLKGPIFVDDKRLTVDFLHIVEQENSVVEFGGKWRPTDCQSRHRVSIFYVKYILN